MEFILRACLRNSNTMVLDKEQPTFTEMSEEDKREYMENLTISSANGLGYKRVK